MQKLFAVILVFSLGMNIAGANTVCSYRMQKKMLHNQKVVKNKVINAQIKGKMLAIQSLASKKGCNDVETQKQIMLYQSQIVDLTNQKMCLNSEYKTALKQLKD